MKNLFAILFGNSQKDLAKERMLTTHRETLLAEIELHKTEYSSLREEINQWFEADRQFLNLSLIAIGAILGFFPFILDQKAYFVLLLLPFLFHVLLWEMLIAFKSIMSLSDYLSSSLVPRLNKILDELGDQKRGMIVFGWEARQGKQAIQLSDWILGSITPTRHWVPILAVAGLLVAYSLVVRNIGHSPSLAEILLVFLNLAFLILAALRNLYIIRSSFQSSRALLD